MVCFALPHSEGHCEGNPGTVQEGVETLPARGGAGGGAARTRRKAKPATARAVSSKGAELRDLRPPAPEPEKPVALPQPGKCKSSEHDNELDCRSPGETQGNYNIL